MGIGLQDAMGRKVTSYAEAVKVSFDVHSISRPAFLQFAKECGLDDATRCPPSKLDDIWRIVNAETVEAREITRERNSAKFLNRHEFMQALLRIAVHHHCRLDPQTGGPRGVPSEALDKLCYEHLQARLPRAARHDANAFRKRHCYLEEVDGVLTQHASSLRALFAAYASLDVKLDDERVGYVHAKRMSAGEWLCFVHDVGLLEMQLTSPLVALQAFQWSRIRALDDYSEASEINLRHLHFEVRVVLHTRRAPRRSLSL